MTDTTTTMTPAVTRVRFGRRPQRGLLLGLSASRVVCAAMCVTVLTVAVFVAGADGVLVAAPVWMGLFVLAFATRMGQPIVELARTGAHYGARVLTRQHQFRARPSSPRPAGTMALPGDGAALRFLTDGSDTAVYVHDPHEGTLTVVARVEHPAYVLLSPDDQTRRVAGWGRVLAGLAASTQIRRLQVLETAAPDRGEGIIGYWTAHRQRAQTPRRGPESRWAAEQYDALMDTYAPSASTHRTLVAVVVAIPRGRPGSRDGLRRGVDAARQEMAVLERGLRAADLRLAGWLGDRDLAAVVRAAYDPAAAAGVETVAGLGTAGPVAVDEHWDHLRHDSGFSAVLWVSEWPRTEVAADFLHALVFEPGVRKSISLTATPLAPAAAMRDIRRAKVEHLTDADQKAKIGVIADLSDAAEYDDVIDRERALLAGHADLRFTGLICVTATKHDELDDAVAQIERSAIQCGCETRRLYGQQARAFPAAALPLARTVS